MNTKFEKIFTIFRTIIFIAPFIGAVFLVYQYIIPSGKLEVNYDFCHESPFISRLSPDGRVLPIARNGDFCQQKMVIDPVYFDVRLPQSFQKAEVVVNFKKSFWQPLKVGVKTSLEDWSWNMAEVVSYDLKDGWYSGVASFDLAGAIMENRRLRFIVSSPDLSKKDQAVIFREIKIKFTKEPLTFHKIFFKLSK